MKLIKFGLICIAAGYAWMLFQTLHAKEETKL